MALLLLFLLAAGMADAKEPARPRIVGVPGSAFFTKDLDKSRAFYREFLGLPEMSTTAKNNGTPWAAFRINDRQYVELHPEVEANTDRLKHIVIETENAEAMRLYLAARGVAVPGRVTKDASGNLAFPFRDPEGHLVQVIQFRPSRSTKASSQPTPDKQVSRRLMHVGIIVTRLEPELRFYTDVLGFREFWRGSSSGTQLSWINLRAPDSEDYIELMLYKEPPAPTARGSAHHLCLETPDISASVAALEAKPYRKEYQRSIEQRVGRNRKRQANLFDPDGTRTELMEPVTVDGQPTPSSNAPPPN